MDTPTQQPVSLQTLIDFVRELKQKKHLAGDTARRMGAQDLADVYLEAETKAAAIEAQLVAAIQSSSQPAVLCIDSRYIGDGQVEFHYKGVHGFDVHLTQVDGAERFYHNLTELHWAYPSPFPDRQVALESDIHTTGITLDVRAIRSIVCRPATKQHACFQA